MKSLRRAAFHGPLAVLMTLPSLTLPAQAAEAAGADGVSANSAPSGASPADSAAGTPDAREIIVTATKQNTSISRLAAAVTALTAKDLGPGGVQSVGDLQGVVPNVSIGDQFGVNRTFIRGVGLNNFDIGGEGAVAFLQNGAIIARPAEQLSGFYDLDQVEVLRGPQSILYGRGATAGAINMVTARPTDRLDGYVRATYGNYNDEVLEGALGGPVSGDKLLVRIAGKYEKHDGYGVNLFTGNPVDNRDSYSLRATVIAKLGETGKFTLVADQFHEGDYDYAFHYFGPSVIPGDQIYYHLLGGKSIFDYAASLGQTPNLRNIYSDQDAINRRSGFGVTGTFDWDLGSTTLKSITAYRSFDRFNRDDLSVSDVNLAGQNNYTEQSRSFSQEITANYTGKGFTLLGGAMYFHERLYGDTLVPTTNLGVLFGLPADTFDNGAYDQNGRVMIDAVGVYLQGAADLSSTLKLTLGARYNYEHREGVGFFRFDAEGIYVPTDQAKGWGQVTPRALLEFRPDNRTLLYASVTKGFKSGVINVGSVNPVINPETVWSYEAGFKEKLFDNHLQLNGAAFYYAYSNLQVSFVNAQSVVETINAASARNFGGELELVGRISHDLTVNLSGTYLNAKFKNFCNAYYGAAYPARPGISYAACPTDPSLVDLSGKTLPNAPKFTFGGGFNYDLPLGNNGKLTLAGDVKWQDTVYFTEFNNSDAEQTGYALANASLTWHAPGDHFSVEGWLRNLTNKYAIANNITAAALFAYVRVGSLVPPRTYGVTAGYKF